MPELKLLEVGAFMAPIAPGAFGALYMPLVLLRGADVLDARLVRDGFDFREAPPRPAGG